MASINISHYQEIETKMKTFLDENEKLCEIVAQKNSNEIDLLNKIEIISQEIEN